MISKRSFIKLLKDDIKKRSWLWILSVLAFCMVFPGMILDNMQGMIAMKEESTLTQSFMEAALYSGKYYYLFVVVAMAAACALSGFSYIHSKSKLDFYFSLPVKRGTWLSVQYLSGLLIFLAPTLLQMVMELLLGMFYHALNFENVLVVAGSFFIYLSIFLASYSLCILAMLVTGKLLVSFLFMPVLFGFTAAVSWIHGIFQRTFYQTYLEVPRDGIFQKYPAPFTLIKDLVDRWNFFVKNGMEGDYPLGEELWILAFAAFLTFVNVWLYRSRKTEAAGNAVVFPKIAVLIEFLTVVSASLGIGICLKTFSYTQSDIWFFGGITAGVVVLTAAVDFIYCMDIRGVLRKPFTVMGIAVMTFGIALTFRFDLLGFDSYLPERDQIASMSINNYGLSNVFHQVLTYSAEFSGAKATDNRTEMLDSYQLTEYEPIYAMAENGRDNARKTLDTEQQDGVSVSIRYTLHSGRNIYRTYFVDDEVFEKGARELYEKPGFIQAMHPIFNRNGEDVQSIYASGIETETGYTSFENPQERDRFLNTYKEELLTLTYDELSRGLIGTLNIAYRGRTGNGTVNSVENISDEDIGYPILGRFTKTLAVLEELGIHFRDTLPAEQVKELTVWYGEQEEAVDLLAVEAGKTDLITDTQKSRLLNMLSYQYCAGTAVDVESCYIVAYGEKGQYLQSFSVPVEDIPEDIQEIVKEQLNEKQQERVDK